jgi:anti-anti-sigma factor
MMHEPATTPFSFAISRALATAVVTIHGELDQPNVDRVTPVLRNVIADEGNKTVVVDLRDVSGVDPSATTLFHEAIGWARGHGARFFVHAPPPVAETLGAERSIREIILA